MTGRHLVMGLALGVAAWLALFADKTPSSKVVQPVSRATTSNKAATSAHAIQRTTAANADKAIQAYDIPPLQSRDTLIGGARNSGIGLFGSKDWTPPPPPPPPAAPPPPPMAPPIPFTYMGKKFDGTNWEVFIGRGEQTHIVQQGSVVENTYHIDAIKPPTMTLTYLPLKQVQTLNIGGTD